MLSISLVLCCLVLSLYFFFFFFFFSSRRRHTRSLRDWSSDVCSSDLDRGVGIEHRRRDGIVILLHRLLELLDRKSTRLNSSHVEISYAVFCLKKKTAIITYPYVVAHPHRRG